MASVSIPFLAICASLIFVIYQYVIYPAFLSPLAKIPAAKWHAHISPLWLYWKRYTVTENQAIIKLHREKGPIVRTAPNELSVNCYEGGMKTIYTGGFPKHEFYARRFTSYGTENMFTMVNRDAHSTRKRMLSNIYAKSVVLASPTLKETTKVILFERLLPIFQNSSDQKQPIDVHPLDYAYAMDSFVGYQLGLSLSPNFVQNVEKRDWYLENFFCRRPYQFWTDQVPRLTEFLHSLGIRVVPKRCDVATDELEAWKLDLLDRAEKMLSEQGDIPVQDYPVIYASQRSQFMKFDGKDRPLNGQPYPRRLEIASDAYCHSAAAHETSGDTLTWLYYEMSRRPKLQEQLRNELLTLDPPIAFPPKDPSRITLPDFKSIDKLSILDAILQETLRLWVAVPGGQPRVTPQGGCSLAGYDNIPAGVRVQSAGSVVHFNPDVFPEPYEWKPERWLEVTPEKLVEMRHWFWAWGSGGRMCIGNNVATHTMKSAIAAVYTNFTTTIVNAEGIEQGEGFTAGPIGNKLVLQFTHV